MDLSQIITPIITLIGGGIGVKFFDSLKEAREGKKLEANRIAKERDHLMALKRRWADACYATRAAWSHYTVEHQGPPPKFPPTPDDDPR